MKIICQNCYEIIADRKLLAKWNERVLDIDPSLVVAVQEIGDNVLLTMQCPKCGCLLQVKS